MSPINILLTDPTGYIGGSVLSALLHHPRLDEFNITVLVRLDVNLSHFGGVRVTPVAGAHDDTALLRNLASKSDVVITCAEADDLSATQAILRGVKQRHRDTATAPIVIHTSGIGVLIDDARGDYAADKVYSDLNIHLLESLPCTQPYGKVNAAVTDAGEEGYAKTCIILPGLVYGIAQTCLTSSGIQNPRSHQIQALVDAGIHRRQRSMIGKGINIWSHVHIEDLAFLYMHIFDAAICSCRLYTGRNGIYFAENGECEVGKIFEAVAKDLSARGCGGSRPTVFKQAEMEDYKFTRMMGSNARVRGDRARSIGWKPVHDMRSMLESIRDEVAASVGTMEAEL